MDRLRKRQWQFSSVYLLVAAVMLYLFRSLLAAGRSREISYSEFIAKVRAGHVAEVNIC